MVIIRADSLEHAHKIAAADPIDKSSARDYRLRPWLLKEGSITINVAYSKGGRKVS